jgi:hypothetical protein
LFCSWRFWWPGQRAQDGSSKRSIAKASGKSPSLSPTRPTTIPSRGGQARVSSSLRGIPVSFSGTVTDLTTHTLLFSFSQTMGHGNGMHNQPTIACTGPPETATAGELGIPGVDPSDIIEFDNTAQVVLKP